MTDDGGHSLNRHSHSALHRLAALPSPPPLRSALLETLLAHARLCAVGDTSAGRSASNHANQAYEVGFALHVQAEEYAEAAALQFELASRLAAESRRAAPTLRPDGLASLLKLEAAAITSALGALDLVASPAERFLLEPGPSRAAKLAAAAARYRTEAEIRAAGIGGVLSPDDPDVLARDTRALPLTYAPTASLIQPLAPTHSADRSHAPPGRSDFFGASEAVESLVARVEAEARALEAKALDEIAAAEISSGAAGAAAGALGAGSGAGGERRLVLPSALRQRRALALGRAEFLGRAELGNSAPGAYAPPFPPARLGTNPSAASASSLLASAEEPSTLLHLLLKHALFDAAAELSLQFRDEFHAQQIKENADVVSGQADRAAEAARAAAQRAAAGLGGGLPGLGGGLAGVGAGVFAANLPGAAPGLAGGAAAALAEARRLSGLPLVAYELAAHAARLDASAGRHAEYDGPESHAEWRRLRLLLSRHDSEAEDWSLGSTAARGCLSVAPARDLPPWLVAHVDPPQPSAADPERYSLLRVSARAAGSVGQGGAAAADGGAAVRRALDELKARHPAANAAVVVRGSPGFGGDATLVLPPGSAAAGQALEQELRALDPGCRPLRRNPAALCRALLAPRIDGAPPSLAAMRTALRTVRSGCDAALPNPNPNPNPNPDPNPTLSRCARAATRRSSSGRSGAARRPRVATGGSHRG